MDGLRTGVCAAAALRGLFHVVQGRIIDIARSAAAVEGAGGHFVQWRALAQAPDEVGIGDEGNPERHRIGLAVVQDLPGRS